ncbi:MAG TPA: hypothetical protein VHF65_09625 [Nitrososphaera sp.]|jgi:hypothetical protein|nr:hypothetical protein [Nitrososphaera sp.]
MADSFIDSATLDKSQESVRPDQPLTLNLSFRIQGDIRDSFSQKNWERAYNKHDKGFLMKIQIDLKSGRRRIALIKLVRKAALFWTRNPKIPYRIWVSIVKDDAPFYPLTEEEAKSLLFDVNKVIELKGSDFLSGTQKVYADIMVSWGKHVFTEPHEIKGRSNYIELVRIAAAP